jgi:hypothetical protein
MCALPGYIDYFPWRIRGIHEDYPQTILFLWLIRPLKLYCDPEQIGVLSRSLKSQEEQHTIKFHTIGGNKSIRDR